MMTSRSAICMTFTLVYCMRCELVLQVFFTVAGMPCHFTAIGGGHKVNGSESTPFPASDAGFFWVGDMGQGYI